MKKYSKGGFVVTTTVFIVGIITVVVVASAYITVKNSDSEILLQEDTIEVEVEVEVEQDVLSENNKDDEVVDNDVEPDTVPNLPKGQSFDSAVHDVKYFFDTVSAPEDGWVRSGYKNEVTIRGRLIAHKPAAMCAEPPCPQPTSSDFRFSLENAQEYIQNSQYKISIRKTGDPIAKDLNAGEIYVISGTLEHMFNDDDVVFFTFDPEEVI